MSERIESALVAAVAGQPPATLPEVIARMEAIQAALPRKDGVACFTRLYLEVTKAVNEALGPATFRDLAFLGRLDVVFANFYFGALQAYVHDPGQVPRAWAPLFEARSRRDVMPIQFALAGMNAHINRDLPIALVQTCTERHVEPTASCPEHADYQRVNTLLAQTEKRVKNSFLTGWLGLVDRVLHRLDRVDDVVAMWDVEKARDAAWTNGETLWALRAQPELSSAFLETLDRTVGFAGRGLLVPVAPRLRPLAAIARWLHLGRP